MLFSSGTLGRFSTILAGTLANPSMYCSGHNNLPPLRLPREGKLIIPETFKLFPDISGAVAADYRGPLDALLRFEGLQAVPNFLDREMGDLSDLGVIDVTSQRLTQRLTLCTQDSMQCFAFRAL